MSLTPAEVAKELRTYSFFSSFSDDLLLQFSALAQVVSYPAGTVILKEGQGNHFLFFLRSGNLQLTLNKEIIAILQKPGEVFGEMSVISHRNVSTTVTALTDVDCFIVDSRKFDSVSPDQAIQLTSLLYQIYSVILTERLTKTNEKARLFEISARELSNDREVFRRGARGDVLLLDADKTQRNTAKLALSSSGVNLEVAESEEKAREILSEKSFQVIICDEKFVDFLKECHENKLAENLILLASAEVRQKLDLLIKLSFVNNVVTRDPSDKQSVIRAILTSSTKILKNDLFGMEKYLTWGADIQSRSVIKSADRGSLKDDVTKHLKNLGIRQSVLDKVYLVAEELLMNAIYDAPTDSDGNSLYNSWSRKKEIFLETHQQSLLSFGCDGKYVGLSVEDPFGALQRETILKYLKSCYDGTAGVLNENKGGAGRGLHQIIENTDITVFNVKKGVRTEVICLFNLEPAKDREQIPTFHYFFSE